ncbi:MAG: hypothetical protein GY948_20145 [Alphaproteobacteria bacterium]|nr:hypothetical protein [Alphaproteobacteria bacterium]
MRSLWMFLPAFFLLPAVMASAGEMTSAYTKIKLTECTKGESSDEEGWATWTCTGYRGMPIYFAHADLREYVGYGPNAKQTCSAHTTFQRFNAVGKTIEWRLKAGRPVATILRFRVEGDGNKEQFLMVTKLDGDQSCPMGYVDARIKNHNRAARNLADKHHQRFSCERDAPIVVSKKYAAPTEFATAERCAPPT